MGTPAVKFYDKHPGVASLHEEVVRGLSRTPRAIAPKFFYDERGSRLFDAICELPEYYPTRTEVGILQERAGEIARLGGRDSLLIELGSGASKKVRLLLEAMRPTAYMGVDISRDFLLDSTRKLAEDYPWLEVHATCADFSRPWEPAYAPDHLRPLAFFPGSSIGNFDPLEAELFLTRLARILGPGGGLLIGVDLRKDPAVLDAAYNDSQGVTAAFNLNLLHRIGEELDAEVDPAGFEHRAFYDPDRGRVEMHLVSLKLQRIRVGRETFTFRPGESIHTENSYKYTVEGFQALAGQAGFEPVRVWVDDDDLFSVHFLTVAG